MQTLLGWLLTHLLVGVLVQIPYVLGWVRGFVFWRVIRVLFLLILHVSSRAFLPFLLSIMLFLSLHIITIIFYKYLHLLLLLPIPTLYRLTQQYLIPSLGLLLVACLSGVLVITWVGGSDQLELEELLHELDYQIMAFQVHKHQQQVLAEHMHELHQNLMRQRVLLPNLYVV